MKVMDLKAYIESHVPTQYVPNMFHEQTNDTCVVVTLGSAGRSSRNTSLLSFQFLVRSHDPEIAEELAFDIFNHFNNKTDYVIGNERVIVSRGQQAVPLYTGTDENNRHIYSVNIESIMDTDY